MRKVGGYSWEDSMEMMSPLWWTPGFPDRFKIGRGYSGTKYLPVFFQAKNLWNGYGDPYDTSYVLDGWPADGGKYAEDYRLTLNEGHQDFLGEYQRWATSRGLHHSAQPAYNMPLDMSSTIPLVGTPELESLGFGQAVDVYPQFTGPAHLFNRTAISTEIGAQRGGAYNQAIPTLLNLFRDSFTMGINTLSIHGFAYNGPYPGTTWPGYTPFNYEFSEMWGPRQPAWRHINDTLLYAARNCEVLKTGVPRVDLAFYTWKQPWTARPVYPDTDLTAAGYTYEYIGPENLASKNVEVRDGVLAPNGPAYKAIVLHQQTRINPSASASLLEFAAVGLPILIVGSGTDYTTIGSGSQEIVAENMRRLTNGTFPSVKVVPQAGFRPEVLWESGVLPRLSAESLDGAPDASQLFSAWRSDPENGLELVYLLNRGPETRFSISFTTSQSAVPHILDAWTGEQTPLVTYLRTSTGLSTRITLAQQQSIILAFYTPSDMETKLPLYVVSHSPNLARLRANNRGDLVGLISNPFEEASVLLSNNSEVVIPAINHNNSSQFSSITLSPWNLTVESYSAPANLNAGSTSSNIQG
ncbi:hypothetical protein MFIFM68171_07023 [Madurella fahalii]|uniref:Uncharacterized protein n=1 Tax=Madurella fahalii TaxID=1157608 RepID=A0ABQ0GGD1_9PEZI